MPSAACGAAAGLVSPSACVPPTSSPPHNAPPQPPTPPAYAGPAVIGPQALGDAGKKVLVLDLDETLVHSSFRPVPHADFVIPVEIDGRLVDVYVLKRPHVDEFLRQAREREGRVE